MTEGKNWHEGVPAPVDADGNIVPLTTRTLYEGDGHKIGVTEYALVYSKHTGVPVWRVRRSDGMIFMLGLCYLERPDSWERIAHDIESAKGWCDQNGDYGTGHVSIGKPKLLEWADRIRKLAKEDQ